MIKRIPMFLFLIIPYAFIITVFIIADLSAKPFAGALGILTGMIWLLNMIYPFILAKFPAYRAKTVLFWDALLKTAMIPFYVCIFALGFMIAMTPKGFIIIPVLMIIDYLILLPTSMYGVSGILCAYRERKITKRTAVIHILLHFFFIADVISAFCMFFIVKIRENTAISQS